MFKKPLADLKTSAPLRSSDRRKLRQRIIQSFSLQPDIGDDLVPDGILSAKFVTHLDEPGVVYLSPDGDPLWMTLGKDSDDFIPTLYTLWKMSDLLPFLSTPSAVIPILIGGADLMIPGVVQYSESLISEQLVAVTQYHHPSNGKPQIGPPLAVGRMAVSCDKLGMSENTKGKAVHIIHTWKDNLWDLGTKPDPPDPRDLVSEGVHGYDGEESQESKEDKDVSQSPEKPVDEELPAEQNSGSETVVLTAQEISDLLRGALIQCIMSTFSTSPQSTFPIPATTFYTAYILPYRPFHPTSVSSVKVDIKSSTHKSLTAFLRTCTKDGLIKIKESKGEISVTGVNPGHKDVDTHSSWKTMKDVELKNERKEEQDRQAEEKKKEKDRELQITLFWKPHLRNVALFREAEQDATALYTHVELRSFLNDYITARQLINANDQAYVNVSADQALLEALSDGRNKDKTEILAMEFMKRDGVLKVLMEKMQAWYEIRVEGKDTVVKKGQLKPISVIMKRRQGRVMTLITGFESFFLVADELADDLRKACACSTAVNPVPGKTSGQEVMVQGKQISVVADLLTSKGVPKKWIEASDLTTGKGK